jgi:uncharacterized protein (TIGR03083 family)
MTVLDFGRHRAEIIAQAALLAGHLDDADVTVPVPSCPGWNVSQLCRHVDGGLRWANEIVATRAIDPPPQEALRDLSDAAHDDPAQIASALRGAAAALAVTLHGAGPATEIWCPVPGGGARFYARRFAHETAIHRADAALAMGIPFELDADVARDGIEEWLELGSMPFHFDVHPWMRELLGPGRAISLRANDTDDCWLLDLTGDAISWRRSDEPAAAELRGPVTDLLLVLYRRMPVTDVILSGDARLVDFWLERVGFG